MGSPSSKAFLHVSTKGHLRAGGEATIVAKGWNPQLTEEDPLTGKTAPAIGSYGLDLFVVNVRDVPGPCFPGYEAEEDVALTRTDDEVRLLTGNELPEPEKGPFKIKFPLSLEAAGPLRICAYTRVDGVEEAAWASKKVAIKAGAKGGRRPRGPRAGA